MNIPNIKTVTPNIPFTGKNGELTRQGFYFLIGLFQAAGGSTNTVSIPDLNLQDLMGSDSTAREVELMKQVIDMGQQVLMSVEPTAALATLQNTFNDALIQDSMQTEYGAIIAGLQSAINDAQVMMALLNQAQPVSVIASGGRVATTAPTQVTPYGFSTSAQFNAVITLLNNIQQAMVLNGEMT